MEFEQLTERIEKKLHENGIDTKTQDHILEYLYINQKLFGKFLDINKVANRIIDNLKNNISSTNKEGNPIQEAKRIIGTRGKWLPIENKIIINPIAKIKSIISKKSENRLNSTIRHEMDHCATTEYIQLSEHEREKYIEYFIKNSKIENPKKVKEARYFVNEIFGDGRIPIVGIRDIRYEIQNGIGLKNLNEGITAYKQEMYDRFLGDKTHSSYETEKKVAKYIGDVIGKETLIQNHFNNDYESIRIAFRNRTGKDLNPLIQELNKEPNFIARKLLGRLYTSKFNKDKNKKIDQFIGETSFMNNRQQKRNTDFVPKCTIDYETVKNKIAESQPRETVKNNEIGIEKIV